MTAADERARGALLAYFSQNGLLLCNESVELPYLGLVGGSWNAIVSLLESGDAFYSRFYKGRVTYLSPELYFALKPHRRRAERLDECSARLLAFLRAAGEAGAEEMQAACLLEKKAQAKALDRLVGELLVTVTRRDATICENWCTFCYGPAERWEDKRPRGGFDCGLDAAERILRRQMPQKQVQTLLK